MALADNAGRVRRTEGLDKVIGDWTAKHTLDRVLEVLEQAQVPGGKIHSIAAIVAGLQYQARQMIERHKRDGWQDVLLPGIVPKLSGTPGGTGWAGHKPGEPTDEVLAEPGYSEAQRARLRAKGVI